MRHLALLCLTLLCVSCVSARYQLPQTEQASRQSVVTAEHAYKTLYAEHQAHRLTPDAMTQVRQLYEAWRTTQGLLVDAIRAGALEWATAKD